MRKKADIKILSSSDLANLEELLEKKREGIAKALPVLTGVRNQALVRLQKTQALFENLNWKQREHINSQFPAGSFPLEEIKIRTAGLLRELGLPNAMPKALLVQERAKNDAQILRRINTARKNLVQFQIIQARVGELTGAIGKSAEAFSRQYKAVCRELFPLGIFSRFWRSIKKFFSRPYFTYRDVPCLRDLGMSAGLVLKIAETPLF